MKQIPITNKLIPFPIKTAATISQFIKTPQSYFLSRWGGIEPTLFCHHSGVMIRKTSCGCFHRLLIIFFILYLPEHPHVADIAHPLSCWGEIPDLFLMFCQTT